MQNLTTLVALAAYIAGLLAWRALYPAPETALLGLAALGLLAIVAMFGSSGCPCAAGAPSLPPQLRNIHGCGTF